MNAVEIEQATPGTRMSSETITSAALLLDGSGHAVRLTADAIEAWRPEDGLLWLHLNYEQPTSRDGLEAQTGLNEVVVDALLASDTRPRVITIRDGLLITVPLNLPKPTHR